MRPSARFLPALRYRFLTPAYDLISRSTREMYFKNRLISLAMSDQPGRVLDLGCGTGTLALMIKRRLPDSEVVAVDCDPSILAMARAKAEKQRLDIKFREAFAKDLPFPDEHFNILFSTLFFHHLDRKQKQETLNEIFRCLCKDGVLLIGDWGKPANRLMQLLSIPVRLFDGHAVTRDNLNGLMPELIAAAGFEQVNIVERISTIFGSLDLIRAVKPGPVSH